MANERGYEALNLRPKEKEAFDEIKENEPFSGSRQTDLIRHLIIEAGYGEYLDD